jgi:hypothetical protein
MRFDDVDFWQHFQLHVGVPDIHERSHRLVKTALVARWLRINGTPLPYHGSDDDYNNNGTGKDKTLDALDGDDHMLDDSLSVS